MKRLILATALFLACSALLAADLTLPQSVSGDVGDFITVKAVTTAPIVKWYSIDAALKLFPTDLLKDTKSAVVIGKAAGSFRLLAYTSDASGPSDPQVCLVTVGPPVPPGPGPGPGPGPDPPTPAPIPVAGLRVLAIYDTAALGTMSRAQLGALMDGNVRAYLNGHCVPGPDGKTKEWRIWDQSVITDAETPLWQAAMKRPRQALPWVIISNGKTGYEGPLPADAASTLLLLQKYGGA
jgi:hypothetical protein